MKKSLYGAAALAAAALLLSACGEPPGADPTGGDDATGGDNADFKACMISDEGGFDDGSFNEVSYAGLAQAESDLGVEIASFESPDPSVYTQNVDTAVQEGCNFIVGVGFALEDAIQAGAEANTDIQFALVDSAFSDADFNPVELPNAKPLLFNTQEAAFLAGYLAAGMSETGAVGTYGGQPFPSVKIFMDGFYDGVMAHNEANGTDVRVLGWDKSNQEGGSFTGDFTNTENGFNTTEQFVADGADIILPVAGPVGLGTAQAIADDESLRFIWVDADGFDSPMLQDYTGQLLSSVMKNMDVAVFEAISAAVDGSFSNEAYVGTLENDGVALAPFHDLEGEVPAELAEQLTALQEQIISGELVVESPNAN